jgi:hypothetical protein
MPVDVQVTFASGTQTFVASDSLALQVFRFAVAEQPLSVAIDPEKWILRTVEMSQSGVSQGDKAPRPPVLSISPNPSNGVVSFGLEMEVKGYVEVRIFDVRGAMVRRMGRELDAGRHELLWDGRIDKGRLAVPGVYWISVDTPTGRSTGRLIRLR